MIKGETANPDSYPQGAKQAPPLGGPLGGLRVLELGSLIAGPFATRLLAEFGAEVIKVESPKGGDPIRYWRYVDPETSTSLWWSLQSRNKKLITLNLKHPEGVLLTRALIAHCDILIENFRPGTLEKLGLGSEDLKAIKPDLITVRVSGFGQTGPYRDQPGFGSVGEAMGGIRYVTGEPNQIPVRPNISLGDSLAGLYAVIGALMALRVRDSGGGGQEVDVALYEAVFSLLESALPEYDVANIIRERAGTSLPGIAPSNTYRTLDGMYLVIAANSDPLFARLMDVIGRPELRHDPRYSTNQLRSGHVEEIDDLIQHWTSQHTLNEAIKALRDSEIPAGPIYSIADIVEDEQYQARGMILSAQLEGVGEVAMPGIIPKLTKTPGKVAWYGGELGQHNQEILCGLLGLPAEELLRLRMENVI